MCYDLPKGPPQLGTAEVGIQEQGSLGHLGKQAREWVWSMCVLQAWFPEPSPGCARWSFFWGGAHPGFSVRRLTGSEPLTILPLTLEPEAAVQAHYKACDRLKLERKQRRMCRRDPGVAETLVEAVSMSALECQYQFRFERWNCTLEGRYRASLLKRGVVHWRQGSWA